MSEAKGMDIGMIKKASEMEITKFKHGVGELDLVNIFNTENVRAKSLCHFIKAICIPGNTVDMHEHIKTEEIWYITKGRGIVNDNGIESEVSVGDAMLAGGGEKHSIKCLGDETLEFISVTLNV